MKARGINLRDGRESKRQARVAQLMRVEIATILRRGAIKTKDPLPDTLREKISIVVSAVNLLSLLNFLPIDLKKKTVLGVA